MQHVDLDQETIEGRILYYIDRVHKGSKLLKELSEQVLNSRITLRVLIDAYRTTYGETAIEDLVGAIIKDTALSKEDIIFVCSYDEERFKQCIHNINQRNKSKEC